METKKVDFGYGCLRLPLKEENGESVMDFDKICACFDTYMASGFNYFDTAYIYMNYKSEDMVRRALVERYPRDSFRLSTKMPLRDFKDEADLEVIFDKQLKNCGVGFFDFYLLHDFGHMVAQKCYDAHIFDFLKRIKEDGRAKQTGVSFHDEPELLEEMVQRFGDTFDFLLLQVNYVDWENPIVQSRKCLEVAKKYNKPVVVMEPCKGGTLNKIPEEAEKLLKEYNPEASIASWAMRFAGSQDGVVRVLSGMNELFQVEDNVKTFKDFKPLNSEEYAILDKVVGIINSNTKIPCTGCSYCTHDCPMQIPIPKYFEVYNNYMRHTGYKMNSSFIYYGQLTHVHTKPDECIKCGQCEEACPQHLPIRAYLEEIAATF